MLFFLDIYKKIIKNPKLIFIFFFLISLFSIINLKKFELDASADTLLLENDSDLNYLREVNERYKSEDFFIITYETKENINDTNILKFKEFVDQINKFSWVSKTLSIFNTPLFESSDKPLKEKIQNLEYITSKDIKLEQALNELKNNPVFKNLILSEDAKVFGVVVFIKENQEYVNALKQNQEFLKKISKDKNVKDKSFEEFTQKLENLKKQQKAALDKYNIQIRSHIEKFKSEAKINLSGIPMIAFDLISFVKNDIQIFGIGVFIFILITLFYIFRDIRWMFFPLICCFFSILILSGLLGFLEWKITIISSNFISLMLILTMEINIHYVERYRQLQFEFPKKNETFLSVLTTKEIFAPILYAVLTTVVAFLSFIFCDIKPVIDFGNIMSIGLFVSLFVSLTLLPYLIIKFKPPKVPIHQVKKSFISEFLCSMAINQKILIYLISFIILLLSIYGISKLKVENSFINYFKKDTEIYKGLKLIDEKLGGTTPLEIIIKFKDTPSSSSINDDFFKDAEQEEFKDSYWFTNYRVDKVTKAHKYLENLQEIGKVLSFYSVLQIGEKLNDNKKLGPLEMAILHSKLPDDVKSTIINPVLSIPDNEARISLRIKDSQPDLSRDNLLKTIQGDFISKLGFENNEFKITGILVIFNNLLQSLFDSQIKTLGITFFAVFVLLLILFRSLKLSIIAAIPNFLAALFIIGALGLLNVPLDMMTITIASITVGIAIDNSIHYIYRFEREFKKNQNYSKTIKICHGTVGKAIVNACLTIVFGFSILVLSNFIPSIYFGIFTGLAMITAMFLVLTLMPRLILLIKPFKNG